VGVALLLEKIFYEEWMDKPRFPVIQGGMGGGISLEELASAVNYAGAMGVVSSVALDQFTSARVGEKLNQMEAAAREVADTKKACGFAAINIMVKLVRDYEASVEGAVKGGANMIISGAGLPIELPTLVEKFAGTKDHHIALVPIVSSARALRIIIERYWMNANHLPDAVVLAGPKCGGHLGFSYREIEASGENFLKDYDLFDVLLTPVLKLVKKYETKEHKIPVFVAGGIRTHEDVIHAIKQGATGVQVGTPFAASYESGACNDFKNTIIRSSNADVMLGSREWGSPTGYPFRYLRGSPLAQLGKNAENNYFCICSALLSSTKTDIPSRNGDCPWGYVKPLDKLCPANGKENVIPNRLYTSGTEIDGIKEIRHAADIVNELAGISCAEAK